MGLSALENLPLELLQQICEYIDDVRAFILASKRCRIAANAILYARIRIDHPTVDALYKHVNRLIILLRNATSFAHVRSLEVADIKLTPSTFRGSDAEDESSRKWQYLLNGRQIQAGDVHDQEWQPLANLIYLLPSLTEFIYSSSPQLAPCVFKAIEAKANCRLRLHTFCLRSLIQPPPQTINVEAYERTLATTPHLSEIKSTHFDRVDDYGNVNFLEDAVLTMTSGLAPRLEKVSLFRKQSRISRTLDNPWGKYRSVWQGTELGKSPGNIDRSCQPLAKVTKGALRYLKLSGARMCDIQSLQKWAQVTDFSKLTCLMLQTNVDSATLRWLTTCPNLRSLQSLDIDIVDDVQKEDLQAGELSTGERFVALSEQLPSLRDLCITGVCDHATLNGIFQTHGPTLRTLTIYSKVEPSKRQYDRIANKEWKIYLPLLEQLSIPIHRTAGNVEEVELYEWLGTSFPKLEKLFLLLDCSYPGPRLEGGRSHARSPMTFQLRTGETYDLRYTLRNHAIDQALAESIYRKIAASRPTDQPPLQRLELKVSDEFERSYYPSDLWWLCKHILGRNWVCQSNPRDDRKGDIVTQEQRGHDVRNDGELEEDDLKYYKSSFRNLWPNPTDKDWRNRWHSFPLADGPRGLLSRFSRFRLSRRNPCEST